MKKSLRKEMKERRAALSSVQRKEEEKSRLARLFALPQFQAAQVLFCYASFGSEFPTAEIAKQAKTMGKRVAYPKMCGVNLHFYEEEPTQQGAFGILEPKGEKELLPTAKDFLLVPALAYTEGGERLGYGGGYYDRYLASLAERPFCCGIGYSCQKAEHLPKEPHDQPLDHIIL